jgi:hypothetical protein
MTDEDQGDVTGQVTHEDAVDDVTKADHPSRR